MPTSLSLVDRAPSLTRNRSSWMLAVQTASSKQYMPWCFLSLRSEALAFACAVGVARTCRGTMYNYNTTSAINFKRCLKDASFHVPFTAATQLHVKQPSTLMQCEAKTRRNYSCPQSRTNFWVPGEVSKLSKWFHPMVRPCFWLISALAGFSG